MSSAAVVIDALRVNYEGKCVATTHYNQLDEAAIDWAFLVKDSNVQVCTGK